MIRIQIYLTCSKNINITVYKKIVMECLQMLSVFCIFYLYTCIYTSTCIMLVSLATIYKMCYYFFMFLCVYIIADIQYTKIIQLRLKNISVDSKLK
jgi:hypothetical protein